MCVVTRVHYKTAASPSHPFGSYVPVAVAFPLHTYAELPDKTNVPVGGAGCCWPCVSAIVDKGSTVDLVFRKGARAVEGKRAE